MTVTLHHGDCLDLLPTLEENSVDTVITDPPYGLQFMGRDWDHGVPGVPYWKAVLRVAKPGAMLLAFGGTRTHHRLMCAIEDAGWGIRDCLMWLYGAGFPKSHDISKAIDKAATVACPSCGGDGVYRFDTPFAEWITKTADYGGTSEEWARLMAGNGGPCDRCGGKGKVVGAERPDAIKGGHMGISTHGGDGRNDDASAWHTQEMHGQINKGSMTRGTPVTPAAKLWDGWGTALKPAYEPIILAMKPRDGTFAHNALEHGVAGLNIDGCRVSLNGEPNPTGSAKRVYRANQYTTEKIYGDNKTTPNAGRFPANLILSHNPPTPCFCSGDWPDCPYCGGTGVVPGCRRVGVRRVGNGKHRAANQRPRQGFRHGMQGESIIEGTSNAPDNYGLETVDAWECSEGCAVALLDAQSGTLQSNSGNLTWSNRTRPNGIYGKYEAGPTSGITDAGGASRFFQHCDWGEDDVRFWYCGKSSRKERNLGLEGMPERQGDHVIRNGICANCGKVWIDGKRKGPCCDTPERTSKAISKTQNTHPTVKPLSLMRYLVRLTRTPTGGVVLDPFCGSGSTGVASILEGRDFIGIDSDIEAFTIATGRTDYALNEMCQLELGDSP